MPHLDLPIFDDPAPWVVDAPAGALVDTTVEMSPGPRASRPGLRLRLGAGAGNRADITVAAQDLRAFDDVQFWVRANRAMDEQHGFLAEVRFGATNLGIGQPSNRWFRYIPASGDRRWTLVTVSLDDAHDRVRRNFNAVRLTVLGDGPATIELASASAIRRAPLEDVEGALITLLGGKVTLGGGVVPAIVAPDAPAGGGPHLRIRPVAARSAIDAARSGEVRTDYTDRGYRVRSNPSPMDLEYAVDVIADTRADQRALTDLLIRSIPEQGSLEVAGRPTPMSWTGPLGTAGDPPVPSAPIRLTVPRPTDLEPRPVVRPYDSVRLEVDHAN